MNVQVRVGQEERGTLRNIVRVAVKQQLYQLTAEVGLFFLLCVNLVITEDLFNHHDFK